MYLIIFLRICVSLTNWIAVFRGFSSTLNSLVFIMFWSRRKNNTPQVLPRLSSPETHNLIGRSWLDKLQKSKVDWFMATNGWLPVPVPYPDCSPAAQKDRSSGSIGQSFNQSNPHRWQGSTARTFIGCSLIIFEMITVAVPCPTLKACTCTLHTQHISLPFPPSIYAQRRAGGILCVQQHLLNTCQSFNLCRGWTRWRERTLSCALVCLRAKIHFFSGWRSMILNA